MIRSAIRTMATILTLLAGPAWASNPPALMPMPQSVTYGDGQLPVDGAFQTTVSGCSSASLGGGLARFDRDMRPLVGTEMAGKRQALSIRCLNPDPNHLGIEMKEAYRLVVGHAGVSIEADGDTGVLRALATLRQLITFSGKEATLPYVRINDAPRFAWRGLMIDVARHFMTVESLKRQIDAMEQAKLNVLHLHLSDNEAFRVESRKFPKLTGVARDPRFYSQAEIRDLVRYAGERGVRIIPEFDMPGHNLAVVTAYPELAVRPIADSDPLRIAKGALNPASERTYRFLQSLLGEMTTLFPDRQFHVGGDEVSAAAWKDSAEVEAFKRKHGLQSKQEVEAWFHTRVRQMLAKMGKSTIGWDEMMDTSQPNDLIVQSWRTSNPVSTATAKGNRVIVSAGYYLDHLQAADYIYSIDPLDPAAFTTMTAQVLEMVKRNPVTAALVSDGLVAKPLQPLTATQEKLVLGGEAPLWSEIVSDEMLDGRLWPRALAVAERLWSSRDLRNPDDMYSRLVPAMDRLRALGLLDDARRDRMVSRLAPDDPKTVRRLVDLVAPVRMFAHMHNLVPSANQKPQDLIEPADAASTDGSEARRFRLSVGRYLGGAKDEAANLRASLGSWRDNEAPFIKVAAGRPLLAAAIPTAKDIAALGALGLAALDALELGKTLAADKAAEGRALIKKLTDFDMASRSLMAASTMRQPPAHLIVLVTPDVAKLFDAANALAPQ